MTELSEFRITDWKYGKTWVYSATYDEALSDLYKFVIPHHDLLGIPGHVEVVTGQIGQIRNIGASSYNGMKHMDAAELKDVIARGWGVGCHSWSHGIVKDDPEKELLFAKVELEKAIGRNVTIYTAPGSNVNLTREIMETAWGYGYLAGASISDDLNRPGDSDIFRLNRSPLHEKFSDLYDSAFDPYKRIRQAKKENGWIIDYLHCPLEKAIHDYKDCSAGHHLERLEAIIEEGAADCWFANPDDVVDYRYMRRYAVLCPNPGEWRGYDVNLRDLPKQVLCRELTFVFQSFYTPEALLVLIDGVEAKTAPAGNAKICFTAGIHDKSHISIRKRIDAGRDE